MIETIQQINYILATLGIIAIALTSLLLYDLRKKRILSPIIAVWGMTVACMSVLSSIMLTLVYSEFFGLIPCGLCWLERILLYPQLLLIGTAIVIKDNTMPIYGIVLSTLGFIISLYHHYVQMGGNQFIKCPAAGVGADCAKRFMFEYGFVTFPLLSGILFTFLIVLYFYILRSNKS